VNGLYTIGPDVYACAFNGVYRSVDEGRHWEVFTEMVTYPKAIAFINNRFVIARTGSCHRSADGVHWDTVTNTLPSPS
jgi:hypothetical protein